MCYFRGAKWSLHGNAQINRYRVLANKTSERLHYPRQQDYDCRPQGDKTPPRGVGPRKPSEGFGACTQAVREEHDLKLPPAFTFHPSPKEKAEIRRLKAESNRRRPHPSSFIIHPCLVPFTLRPSFFPSAFRLKY
jgi:hypothetical protein